MNLNIPILLAAIAMVENSPQHRIGAHGERSVYQITERVWRQHMGSIPFTWCTTSKSTATVCAQKHIAWIRPRLITGERFKNCDPAYPVGDSPYCIGVAWNAGLDAFNAGTAPYESILFGERVSNLYLEALKNNPLSPVP